MTKWNVQFVIIIIGIKYNNKLSFAYTCRVGFKWHLELLLVYTSVY